MISGPDKKRLWKRLIAAVSLSALFVGLWETFVSPDFFSYLALGGYVAINKSLPAYNFFTYIPSPRNFINHAWSVAVLTHLVYESFGFLGIQCYRWALALATLGLVYYAARKRGASRTASLAVLGLIAPFAPAAFPLFLARNFSYFYFVLCLHMLEETGTSRRKTSMVLLPVLFWAWANTHMSVPAGFILFGIYIACGFFSRPRPRWLMASGAAAFALTFATPFGADLWENFLVSLSYDPNDYGGEWLPLAEALKIGFDKDVLYPFLGLLPLAGILWARFLKGDLAAKSVMAVMALLAFKYNRHVTLFALVFGVYAPLALDRAAAEFLRTRGGTAGRAARTATVAVLLTAAALSGFFISKRAMGLSEWGPPLSHSIPARPVKSSVIHSFYPVGAVEYMKSLELSGDVLTWAMWGGYLSWECFPRVRSAVDGRAYEEYPKDIYNDYVRFYYGMPGWRRILERFPPDHVLVHANTVADVRMSRLNDWCEIYRDEVSALYTRIY